MKVSGSATLHATPERVYAALNDPAVLVRTIPGCEQLEAIGPDHYRMAITAGVASIKGSYLGDVALSDGSPPSSFTLSASGSGAPGTVTADVRVHLDDPGDGTTLLSYEADAVVGGPVGGVGQRVLSGVAKKTAGQFFAAVDALLLDGGPVPLAAVPAAPVAPTALAGSIGDAAALPGVGSVFTRPRPEKGGDSVRVTSEVRVTITDQVAGIVAGAAAVLLGIWIGYRLALRRAAGDGS